MWVASAKLSEKLSLQVTSTTPISQKSRFSEKKENNIIVIHKGTTQLT